jgi:hypothetical protein
LKRRAILIGAVSTAPARLKVRDDGQVMVEICDELDERVQACLVDAPFATVSIILRYEPEASHEIEIGRINKRHSELEVGISIPVAEIKPVDRDTLKQMFRERVLRALQLVGEKYRLPCDWTQ